MSFMIVSIMFILMMLMFNFVNLMNNFLSFMIGLEFFIISILYFFLLSNLNMWFFLIYLIFSVAESVLGLSLLVSMNFEYGHQKINLMNLC